MNSKYGAGRLAFALTSVADNKARVARYHRRDGVVVDTTTGEILEPAPASLKERVLSGILGERKPASAPSLAENYGRRAAGPIGSYIRDLPNGKKTKRVFAAVALIVCALIAWRMVAYTIPQMEADERVREAVIAHNQERIDYLESLSPEGREAERWEAYWEYWGGN